MPFIKITARKRRHLNSGGQWIFSPSQRAQPQTPARFGGANGHVGSDKEQRTIPQTIAKDFKARLQKGGFRIRSLLSLSSSRHRIIETTSSHNEQDATDNDHTFSETSSTVIHSCKLVSIVPKRHLCSTANYDEAANLPQKRSNLQLSVSHEPSPMETQNKNPKLRRSQFTGGISHRLSHRFSSTFSHPTIVHRTELRVKPSVHGVYSPLAPLNTSVDRNVEISQVSTMIGSSESSPTEKPASLTSPCHIDKSQILTFFDPGPSTIVEVCDRGGQREQHSPTPEHFPSIVTVESTATAKIFFETHFNNILARQLARRQRLQELEERLQVLEFSRDHWEHAYQLWLEQESESLRQDRVLKSKTNGIPNNGAKSVSIAGYDVIRVLGKGSFGVVKLVKQASPSDLNHGSPANYARAEASEPLSLLKWPTPTGSSKDLRPHLLGRKKKIKIATKEVYAMKVIRKSDMIRNIQEGHLRAERDFLVASEGSRWVVPLMASFQDTKNLYLVMEYCIGGDFFSLLIRKNTLNEDITKHYFAEMILCVEEAHRLRWIHRDVKPDNFLISASGHLKISDFGLAFDGHWTHEQDFFHKHRHSLLEKLQVRVEGDAQDKEDEQVEETNRGLGTSIGNWTAGHARKKKSSRSADYPQPGDTILGWRNRKQQRKLAKSVVGTSQYMAPEVIRGDLYDGRCDWWSIGIILYECLYGDTPFVCDNRQDTKMRILRYRQYLDFPEKVKYKRNGKERYRVISDEAIHLIKQLLCEKEGRLSSKKYILNDYTKQATTVNGVDIYIPANKTSEDYQGIYVYADDADELKQHAFFDKVDWNNLHLIKPPFVPNVSSGEDTKYFDEADVVSAVDSNSSEEPGRDKMTNGQDGEDSPLQGYANIDRTCYGLSGQQPEDQHIVPSNNYQGKTANNIIAEHQRHGDAHPGFEMATPQQFDGAGARTPNPTLLPAVMVKSKKEKKRARDKILRDLGCGKLALELRKKGAFLGYEYRRPKGPDVVVEKLTGGTPGY
jgi:serine/threonine protein kinase